MNLAQLGRPPCIVVTGGTGFVGRAVCERLVAHFPGVRLRVPTRQPGAQHDVRTLPGLELTRCDVHNPAQVSAALQGADALVNLVAILHGNSAQFERVHVALPRTLATAAQGAGVARVVHVSALGVAANAPSNYLRSKAAGEAVWRAWANQEGNQLALLRPSVIFGADDRFTNLFARLLQLFPVLPLAGSTARFQPVWVGDVAQAVVQVLAQGLPAGGDLVLECAGPEVLTLADIVHLVGRMSGHARPVLPLPEAAALLQATLMGLAPGAPLMSRDNVLSMRVPNTATGENPGLAAMGITPMALAGMARHFAPRPVYRGT